MENKFNEIDFLKCVRHLSNIIPNVIDDKTAKHLIASIIKQCGYGKEEVFTYILSEVKAHSPELLNKRFDIEGWKKIYDYFINNPKYPKFGKVLNEKQPFLKSEEDYGLCFTENAKYFSLDPEMFLNEIRLDCIGWWLLYTTFIKMAMEKGIAVEEPTIEMKGRKGRRSKKTEITKEEITKDTFPKSPEISEAEPFSTVPHPKSIEETPKSSDYSTDVVKPKSRTKRQYNVPIVQYKRERVFDTIEAASETTGVNRLLILDCINNRPDTKVERIWRYADKKKQRIVLYTILHTYKNQNDLDISSKEVCGKKVYHNNIELKKWDPVYRGEYVWIQLSGDLSTDTIEGSIAA